MDQPSKPKEPITLDGAAGEETPGQSDRPYPRLNAEQQDRIARGVAKTLPDLKLAQPSEPSSSPASTISTIPTTYTSDRPYPKLSEEQLDRIASAFNKTLPDLKLACKTTSTNAPPRPRSDQAVLDRQNQQFAENLKAAALADKSIS